MIAQHRAMDASLAVPRNDGAEDSTSSGGMTIFLGLPDRLPTAAMTASMLAPALLDEPTANPVNAAEGPARKRFQRSTIENENPLRKQAGPAHVSSKISSDQKSTLASRRRSILTRDNKPVLTGPRPLELSPGKR